MDNELGLIVKDSYKVPLNQNEKAYLAKIKGSEKLLDISPYLESIFVDGAISATDAPRIEEFVNATFMNESQYMEAGARLPDWMLFLQNVIIPRIGADGLEGVSEVLNEQPRREAEEPSNLDMENLPSYLPKVYDLIEREVKRRVREEMKDYNELKKKYNDLKAKFESIFAQLKG